MTTNSTKGDSVPRRERWSAPNAWRVVALLAAANVLNFYDRTIPAIVVEPMKDQFGLTDLHVGVLGSAFTLVCAVAGIALGRLADRAARRTVMGVGLIIWSAFTAASGGAWSFASLLIARIGVGIGEASYAPAATATISDLLPADRRSRAIGVFQLGLPVGLTLAFFTTGAIADAFGSFRAPFFVAALPGLVVGVLLLRIREPQRGASDNMVVGADHADGLGAVKSILAIPTMRWIILSGIGVQVASYAVVSFIVPYFQRYYGLSLTAAALNAGFVLGLTGIVGLVVGGAVADRASRHSARSRVLVGAVALLGAAPLTLVAFSLGPGSLPLFVGVLSAAWLLQFAYFVVAYPAVSDVVRPDRRATAVAVFASTSYLLGGGFGPIAAGALSEFFKSRAGEAAVSASAHGLQGSLVILTPAALLICAIGLFGAARTIAFDALHPRADGALADLGPADH